MAGIPQQPYGPPQQPMPQFAPHVGRQPGSVAPKVWGVLLLIFGILGLIFLLFNVASLFGGGLKASSFSFNMSPEAKAEIDSLVSDIAQATKSKWSTWASLVAETVTIGLSLAAGFLLVIRTRPVGRKLAVARALFVLLTLPVYGYANIQQLELNQELTDRMQKIQVDDMVRQEEARNPSKSDREREQRRREKEEVFRAMQPVTEVVGYATVAVMGIGILVINGLLLFFMTRPAVKEYMESIGKGGDNAIPGYDPSMGYAAGPPPGYGQPPDSSA